jgi:NAD(P)-dependent dehydrogenase (short-subunit alcohol dehydrogenase family)
MTMGCFDSLFDQSQDFALVTGAGNGIGRAIACALVEEGVRTVFADVDRGRVDAAIQSTGRPALALPWVGDLADAEQRQELLRYAFSVSEHVTHFVHSASPPRHERDDVLHVTESTWAQMQAVNVEAAWDLSTAIARKLMSSQRRGAFLLLTSLHAQTPRNLPHYSTSKAALKMLAMELAKAFGRHGIRVNALAPGAVAAGGFVAAPSLVKHIPLGRVGDAKELAPVALTLLSERTGSYITGTEVVVDGGISLSNWFDVNETRAQDAAAGASTSPQR